MSWGFRCRLPEVERRSRGVLVLPAEAGQGEVRRLCAEARVRLSVSGCRVLVCDAAALSGRSFASVELLARLELAARRAGGRIRVRGPSPGLRALLDLAALGVEVEGQIEEGEPTGRVEEGVDPGDTAG
ncbi:STAS domain-containing protein [Streptomyces sp. NPDC058045]|uniref:STAS domain-containing protein n=1 Tax=Streptomyces sp. NPDC058045 TaxID=3346311 RepID=UPI0036E7BFC3